MPPAIIIGAIASAALSTGIAAMSGAFIFGLAVTWTNALIHFGISMIGSLALAGVQALVGQGKTPNNAVPFASEAQGRAQVLRTSIGTRKVIIGEAVVGGQLVFAASYGTANGQVVPVSTPGNPANISDPANRDNLVMVIALAGHKVSQIWESWINDTLASATRFGGALHINTHLGDNPQSADAELVNLGVGWTSAHRLDGIAYIVVFMTFNENAFPTGIPNIKTRVWGAPLYDPRLGISYWNDNAALAVAWYLDQDFGMNADDDEIGWDSVIAAANACDEIMDTPSDGRNVIVGYPGELPGTTAYLFLTGPEMALNTGDRVRVYSTGAFPTPLAGGVDYYVRRSNVMYPGVETRMIAIHLAATLLDARAGAVITMSDAGSGIVQVYRTGQPRYTANGVIDTGKSRGNIADELLTAMVGAISWQDGGFNIYAGAPDNPVMDLTVDDLRKPLPIQPRRPKRETFNRVRGTYVSRFNSFQPGEFSEIRNALYEAEDGEPLYRDLELPFTNDDVAGQRIAKVHLELMRQSIIVQWPAQVRAMQLQAWCIVTLTVAQTGWSTKQFRVVDWSIAEDFGVDLLLREYADACYDWNGGAATLKDPAPNTSLPSPWFIPTPQITSFLETKVVTRTGAGVANEIRIDWAPVADANVSAYVLQYRLFGDSEWLPFGGSTGSTFVIRDDVPAGTYEFRLQAFNTFGVHSDYSAIRTFIIVGLTDIPEDVTGFSIVFLGGKGMARWDPHPALDVINGGHFEVRWSPEVLGVDWSQTNPVPGLNVAGDANETTLPNRSGTWMIKAVDSNGNISNEAAVVVTTLPDLQDFNVVATVAEEPTWSGTHSGTAAADGFLYLDGSDDVDGWADVDSRLDWDWSGGVGESGTYEFATITDLGDVYTVRIVADFLQQAFLMLGTIDGREGDVDTWPDWDGDIMEASAEAVIEIRTTLDDPGASPTWSDWVPFITANYTARAFHGRARLARYNPDFNVRVDRAGYVIDVPDRTEKGSVLTSAAGNTTVNFASAGGAAFYEAVKPGFQINGAVTGDYPDLVSFDAETLVFCARNAAGARIAKTVYWEMKGWGRRA